MPFLFGSGEQQTSSRFEQPAYRCQRGDLTVPRQMADCPIAEDQVPTASNPRNKCHVQQTAFRRRRVLLEGIQHWSGIVNAKISGDHGRYANCNGMSGSTAQIENMDVSSHFIDQCENVT